MKADDWERIYERGDDLSAEAPKIIKDLRAVEKQLLNKTTSLEHLRGILCTVSDRADKAEGARDSLVVALEDVLDDFDIVHGPGACDGPEGSRTTARSTLAGVKAARAIPA